MRLFLPMENYIVSNFRKIQSGIAAGTRIVAVSKTHTEEKILHLYNVGHRIFGENRVQELLSKYENLPEDIEWHFIGHLQTNKVKYIAPFVSLIHSVDSLKLLQEINKEAKKNNRIIPCLLEVYIATEETKFGMNREEVKDLLNSPEYLELKNICISGLMGMASFTSDTNLVQKEFQYISSLFKELKSTYFKDDPRFCELSIGMSGDYKLAIEEGSTLVRIGSSIFGER